ncbi:GntR family transcriptional regulator [Paraburkholderia xenovorans]|uniref:GntR family transcriptional regulator n=1 Tax=Paraburkholderia xenovorans TaxID=36873 RepID=UPI0038BD44D0
MSASTTQTLPRARGTSLHRQMFLVLRERIVSGGYPAGSLIPKEEDLCTYFGVSRITARRALTDLEAQGYVYRRQGLGTFVPTDLPVAREAATLGFVDALHKSAEETTVEVLNVEVRPVPLSIAQQLQLEPGDRAIHALRLRKIGDVTVMVTDAWVPERYSKAVTATTLKKRALYEILMSQGVEFGRVIQEVTAVAADPTFAQWLGTEVGVPLLRTSRLVYDTNRIPVQHLTLTVTPERSRIVTDMSVDSMNTLRTGQIVHNVQQPDRAAGKRRG